MVFKMDFAQDLQRWIRREKFTSPALINTFWLVALKYLHTLYQNINPFNP
jgi:hypothetical protein